jgi:hypothetical protein
VPLIGKRVELLYHQSDLNTVEVKYKNKSYGMIRPVNLSVNYRIKRDKNNNPQIDNTGKNPPYQSGKLWSAKRRNKNEA